MLFGALRRLGAVQNPILPIYREREVRFIIRQAGSALLVVPSTWKGFDYEAMAHAVAEGTDTEVLVSDRSLPDGDPATLPPAARRHRRRPGRRARPRPVPLLHVGHDGRPQGCAATATGRSCPRRSACPRASASPRTTASPSCSRSPTSAAASTSTPRWRTASPSCSTRRSTPAPPSTCCDERTSPMAARARSFHHGLPRRPSEDLPEGEPLFPHVRGFPGGGAPKPPQLHYELKDELAASASCRATA